MTHQHNIHGVSKMSPPLQTNRQQQHQSFYSHLSQTTRLSQNQKKHSLTHTYPDHQSSFIGFLHLLRSIASSLFNLRARQSFSKISVKVLFSLPLGLEPFNSYSIHFFTQTKSIIIIESCLSVCVLSPPKRLDVRRRNLARRRVTMLSYTWAGSNVNRGMEHSSRN